MAMEVAMEDDVFFADLNRQISMLIDEEDDDDVHHVSRLASFSAQEFPRMVVGRHPPILASQYEMYQQTTNNCAIAREMSKGTGVFIPQSTHPRRRYKQQQQQQQGGTNKHKQFTNNPRARSNINNNINNNNNNVASHTTFSPAAYPTNLYNGY